MLQTIITYLIIAFAVGTVIYRFIKRLKRSVKQKTPFCPTGCSLDCSTCPFASSAYRYKKATPNFEYRFPAVEDKTDTVDLKHLLK